MYFIIPVKLSYFVVFKCGHFRGIKGYLGAITVKRREQTSRPTTFRSEVSYACFLIGYTQWSSEDKERKF